MATLVSDKGNQGQTWVLTSNHNNYCLQNYFFHF